MRKKFVYGLSYALLVISYMPMALVVVVLYLPSLGHSLKLSEYWDEWYDKLNVGDAGSFY